LLESALPWPVSKYIRFSPSVPRPSDRAAARASLQQRQVDAEAGVGRLGAGDRLEHEVDRRAAFDRFDGVGHVGQHAGLGGNRVAVDDLVEHGHELDHLRHVVGGRVDADDGVAAAVHQAVEQAGGDAGCVIERVVRLQPGREGACQADRIAKARDDAALAGDQHQVLDAHDLRDGGRHLRRDAGRGARQQRLIRLVAEQPVAETADSQVADRREGGGIVGIDDQARDLVGLVGHHGLVQEGGQRQVGQGHLRRHPFLGAAGGNAGQVVARARRGRLRQQLTQAGEGVGTAADKVGDLAHGWLPAQGWRLPVQTTSLLYEVQFSSFCVHNAPLSHGGTGCATQSSSVVATTAWSAPSTWLAPA
jgi:hypothetical protein